LLEQTIAPEPPCNALLDLAAVRPPPHNRLATAFNRFCNATNVVG